MNELVKAIGLGLFGLFGYGGADIEVSESGKKYSLSASQIGVIQYAVTTAIVCLAVGLLRLPLPRVEDVIVAGPFVLIAIGMNYALYMLFYSAISKGKLSIISPIFSLYPIVTTIISIWFGEPFSLLRIISILGLIIGGIALSLQKEENKKGEKIALAKGVPQVVAATILLGVFFSLWDEFLGTHSNSLFWAGLIDLGITIAFFLHILFVEKSSVSQKGLNYLIPSGIFNAVAVIAITIGLATTTMTSVIIAVSSPIALVTIAYDYFIAKNKLSRSQMYGGIVLVISIIVLPFT